MVGTAVSHFRILEPLGAGAMGEVFLAEDTRLARRVALKFLPRHLTADAGARTRFLNEARAASALDHPNICAVHEMAEGDDGQLLLVMAVCEGESLGARLARGVLPPVEAIALAAQVADGLSEAHARGIVHRDIKPANLIVGRTGRVKIVDFGIARLPGSVGATTTGVVVGTPAYMAPEQARGEPIDARADLWALGAVLYEMLTGRQPFLGNTAVETRHAILYKTPEPIERLAPNLPPAVVRIVSRALSKDPVARYQQAEQMLADLQACQQQAARAPRVEAAAPGADRPSIAVLPFANLSADKEQEYFCDGMTEELSAALSALRTLRVTAHTSAMQFKGQAIDIRRVGEQLNVQTVLEGSVRKAGSRLRVTAQLVNAADGYHLWSERYDRDLDDVFRVQEDIARAITEKLKVELTRPAGRPFMKRPTDNLEAYQAYLKGRHLWAHRYSLGPEPARQSFARALEFEADFPAALAGLADCYTTFGLYSVAPVPQVSARARVALERALALDDTCAEAHASVGRLHMFLDWNWPAIERAFGRALDLEPDAAQDRAYFAMALAMYGREPEAIREAEQASARDPLSAFVHYLTAGTFYFLRDYHRAVEEGERALELDPHMHLGGFLYSLALSAVGRHDEAVSASRRLLQASKGSGFMTALSCVTFGAAGLCDEARALAQGLLERQQAEGISNGLLAIAWLGAEEWERAIEATERAVRAKDGAYPWLLFNRCWDPVRSDPRYARILEQTGYVGTSRTLLPGK